LVSVAAAVICLVLVVWLGESFCSDGGQPAVQSAGDWKGGRSISLFCSMFAPAEKLEHPTFTPLHADGIELSRKWLDVAEDSCCCVMEMATRDRWLSDATHYPLQ